MEIEKRLFNLSELMANVFETFQRAAKKMVLLNLTMYLFLIPVMVVVLVIAGIGVAMSGMADTLQTANPDPAILLNPLVMLAMLLTIIFIFALSAVMGAANIYMSESYIMDKEPLGVWKALQKGCSKIVPLGVNLLVAGAVWLAVFSILTGVTAYSAYSLYQAGSYALTGIVTIIGIGMFIAAYFLIVYVFFFAQATVLRDKGLDAFKYSIELVKNRFWLTLGYFLVMLCIIMAVSVAITACSMIVSAFFGIFTGGNQTALSVINTLVSIAFLPLNLIPTVLVMLFSTTLFLNRDFTAGEDVTPPSAPQAPEAVMPYPAQEAKIVSAPKVETVNID